MIDTSNASTQLSAETLTSDVNRLSNAGAALIQIRTREPIRAAGILRQSITLDESEYREWDVVNGFRSFTVENATNNLLKGDGNSDFFGALMAPLDALRDPMSAVSTKQKQMFYWVYVDPHPYIADNPIAHALLQQYAAILPSTNVCLILVTPDVSLGLPLGTVLVSDMPTPTASELSDSLRAIVTQAARDYEGGSDLDDDDYTTLGHLGLGLTLSEFETYAALSLVEAGHTSDTIEFDGLSVGISRGKTEVVKQSEVLELYPQGDIQNVGGMRRLKDWVAQRSRCYSEEARDHGIKPPKGITLVGVPGTGKSLVAKCIAGELGVPLVRFDFGRVFSKYVGDSESRVRQALKMVESMAPVVLFVDEIDKGLGGIGGGGDSGVSSRVLGTFLTWLQDNTAPVFVMVTANSVEHLPPELTRRGRFDAVFAVTMPGPDDRREVLRIHLRLRGHGKLEFTDKQWADFIVASEGFVPAEIEAALQDALIMSFNDGEDLSMSHIVAALKDTIPMSVSYAAKIDSIVRWAENNAISVDYPTRQTAPTSAPGLRRTRTR